MAQTISRTLRSIVEQDYENIEIVVVDGQSVDGTLEQIDQFGDDVSTFISEPDRGLYDAVNKGLDKAAGHVIGILNGDDYYSHDGVGLIRKPIQQRRDRYRIRGPGILSLRQSRKNDQKLLLK